MGRKLFVISDESEFVISARAFAEDMGATVKVYTQAEWARQSSMPGFAQSVGGSTSLTSGAQPVDGAKILQFPQGGVMGMSNSSDKVHTINELESVAIHNAIHNFNGNLTEAAKALGIGRATLYRKVKQYNIDPGQARRKKAA